MKLPVHAPAGLLRSAGALAAKRAGDDFESELDAMHAPWIAAGVCRFQHAAVKTVRAKGELIVTGKSGVDRVGVFRGQPVAFDAKSHRGEASFALLGKRGTERAECAFLADFARAGGTAFFLIRDPELLRVYLVGPAHFPALLAGDRVRLRDDKTPTLGLPLPLVPCLQRTPDDVVRTLATGRPLWPWPDLLRAEAERLGLPTAASWRLP